MKKEGFTELLAVVDAIPVLLFAAIWDVCNMFFHGGLFFVGGCLCIFAGLGKVIWKMILARKNKDIRFWFLQFRVTMPMGFLLMLFAIIMRFGDIPWARLLQVALSFPIILCWIVAILTMVTLIIMAKYMNQNSATDNWIEQMANIIMQSAIFIGVLAVSMVLR